MNKSLFSQLAFWRKQESNKALGIYIDAGVVNVYCPGDEQESPRIVEFPLENNDWRSCFSAVNKAFGGAKLQLLLSASYYQIMLADKPNVPAEEMHQALLWSVKDLVSMPVADIHLDYFESPLESIAKVNVVVISRPKLVDMVSAALSEGFSIAGVSIEELAMANLFPEDPQARLVISHQANQELMLTVVRQGELFMQRRVRGFSQIDTATAEELSFGSADNLSLEIQRSMDFFESQLRQAPVASIELMLEGELEALASLVGVNFNQAVNAIQFESVSGKKAQLAHSELNRGAA